MASVRITMIASKVSFGIMCFGVMVVFSVSWNFMMKNERKKRKRKGQKRREIG